MATLTLNKIWVNLYSTGQAVSANSVPGREETYEVAGEVRTYAGGRRRAISTEGVIGVFKFALRLVARSDVDTLLTWVGQPVQVRDHKGRRFVGVYYGLAIGEYVAETGWDVGIVLNVVTANEEV